MIYWQALICSGTWVDVIVSVGHCRNSFTNTNGSFNAYRKVPMLGSPNLKETLRVHHIASQGLFIPGLCAFERRDAIGDYGGLSFDAARWCFAGRWPGLACSWIRSVWISQGSKDPSVAWRRFWSLKCRFSCFCMFLYRHFYHVVWRDFLYQHLDNSTRKPKRRDGQCHTSCAYMVNGMPTYSILTQNVGVYNGYCVVVSTCVSCKDIRDYVLFKIYCILMYIIHVHISKHVCSSLQLTVSRS